ncbi:MAG: TraB/GumN family protein, partial [Weeksellaceae bacterium]
MNKLVACMLIFGFQLGNAQEIKEKALLWEISGNKLEKPSYLFGTLHLACEGDVEMRPEIQAAFDASENLILEIAMDDPALMTKMMQASISTDGKTISEKLGKDLAVKVDSLLLEKMGTGLNSFDQLNLPTLSAQMSLLSLDCPMALGYDMALTLEAEQIKKEVLGLESIEKQIEVLFSQSDEEAIQTIQYIVDNLDEFILETQQLMELYKQQNIQEMYN